MRTKQRLTITLPPGLISQIDILMARQGTVNRSQTIETLLTQTLPPQIDQAVILAGGHKSDLKMLLTDVGGQYLLSRLITQLRACHITQVVICADPASIQALKDKFGSGQGSGLSLRYSIETEPLGTAGAVTKAAAMLDHSPFLVMHGDVLTQLDFKQFIDFHLREGAVATIAVKPRLSETKFGQVFLQGNKIVKFNAGGSDSGIAIVNTGLYIFDWEVINFLPKSKPSYLEQEVFPVLAKNNALAAYFFQGFWADLSDQIALSQAEQLWSQKRPLP